MIIGGVGAVCKPVEGGCVIGFKEAFLPCLATLGSEPVDNAFRNRSPIKYSALVRIRNVADTDWITLSDVIFFQVSGNQGGGGSANLTIRKPEKWSIDGAEYPDLLRPSSRIMQIICTIQIGAASYSLPVFTGTIENYNESHGQSGGSISVTAKINSLALDNRPVAGIVADTAYRRIFDELDASGLFSGLPAPLVMIEDYSLTSQDAYTNLLAMVEGVARIEISITTSPNGGILIRAKEAGETEEGAFTLEDGNQVSISRSIGSAASYNRIMVIGSVDGVITAQAVSDAEDISRRGVVQYPYRYGAPERELELNVIDAEALIAESLRGKLSAQVQLNPFLRVGTVLNFESTRLFISEGRARVGSFTHSYSVGQAVSTIYDMAVLS